MSELTHFGVPGMKWGHRKAVVGSTSDNAPRQSLKARREDRRIANRVASVKRGDALIAKYGRVNKAYLAVGVRRVAVTMANIGANKVAGNMAMSKMQKKGEISKMALGLNIVANGTNAGMFIVDLDDARGIHLASKSRGN